MAVKLESKHLLLKSSLALGVIIFFTYLIFDLGLLSLIIASDQSKISLIILALYYLATAHWYYLSFSLDKEIEGLNFEDASSSVLLSKLKYFDGNDQQKSTNYLAILEDELANRHALGYMIVDILLKLGLTGTVIGFILMLLPIGEIKDFDPQIIQQLLSKMSGGMAVALYTTLTGLVTSTLLKLQYFLLDTSLTGLFNYLSSRILDEA
ncbi:MotA/TolQ/ExbB proton channel family protein [Gammaproteobacteria bacterium]|nr:MotA/TolQ/ExbB proton channel family protein [Gammaproteobacteria bacterium]